MDFFKKARERTPRQLDWEWFISIIALAITIKLEAYSLSVLIAFISFSYYLKSIVELLADLKRLRERELI